MSLQATTSSLHEYVPVTLKCADVMAAISVITDLEPKSANKESFEILKEDVQVEIIFHSEIISVPNLLLRVVQDYLVLNEVPYTRQPRSNELFHGTANYLKVAKTSYMRSASLNFGMVQKNVNTNFEKCQPQKQ